MKTIRLMFQCSNVQMCLFIFIGDPPSIEKPTGVYPVKVTKDNGKTALIVQAYSYTKYLGNLTVMFDIIGDITAWDGNPILLDNSVVKGNSYSYHITAMLVPSYHFYTYGKKQ